MNKYGALCVGFLVIVGLFIICAVVANFATTAADGVIVGLFIICALCQALIED